MKFKELPTEDKPRERLKLYGVEVLSNEELLMILLNLGLRLMLVNGMTLLKSNYNMYQH